MEYIIIPKIQIYILCWAIAFFVFVDFMSAAVSDSTGLAVFNAILTMFWIWWPFKMVNDGREKLKELSGTKDE